MQAKLVYLCQWVIQKTSEWVVMCSTDVNEMRDVAGFVCQKECEVSSWSSLLRGGEGALVQLSSDVPL